MKHFILSCLTIIFFVGCTLNTPSPSKQAKLSDVSYKINKKGDIKLTKTYKMEDGNITTKEETINHAQKEYEIVPNFEKSYANNLKLNSKQTKKEVIKLSGGDVKISVESIPINQFIDLVFSKVLHLNYTVGDAIKKLKTPISLNMSQVQPKKEVFAVVKKLLLLNGVSIRKENGVFFIYKKDKNEASKDMTGVYIGYGRSLSSKVKDDEKVLMFVPYDYINPSNSVTVFRRAGLNSLKFFYPIKGIQMMEGDAQSIRRALAMKRLIDRPYLEGKKLYLVEFQNIEVSKFTTRMKAIFASNSINVTTSPSKGGILMTQIPELNSLLVISPKRSWIDMLLYWKKKLDIKSEISKKQKFYTYKVKNRKADDLAKAINAVLKMKLTTITDDSQVNKKAITTKVRKVNLKSKTQNTSNASIVADLPTNMLMMKMTPEQYRKTLPLIEKLDALPLQVLTEVTLAEVTMTNAFNLGFDYTFKNNKALNAASSVVSGAISGAFGGTAGFTATYSSKNLEAVINAYAQKQLLNILSRPKILILNNETGMINVGSQVPVITSQVSASDIQTQTTPSILQNVQYRNTGVTVNLTPTINSNGILTMKVDITLSEAQLNDTSSIDSPLIVNRALSTVLTIKSDNSVLLGGLISTNVSSSNSGVPILKDIPLIGNLFKTQSKKKVKTELIMLIHPYIIKVPQDLNEKTQKYRRMLKMLDKYIAF